MAMRIYGVTFSADGRLATTSHDGKVRLYDRAFKLVVPPKKVTGGAPFGIAFSPDGALLAVGYDDAPTVDASRWAFAGAAAGAERRRLERGRLVNCHLVKGRQDALRGRADTRREASALFSLGLMRAVARAAPCRPQAIRRRPGGPAGWSALRGGCKTRSWSCWSPTADLAGCTLRPRQTFEIKKTDWRCRQTAPLSILASSLGASRRFALICARSS